MRGIGDRNAESRAVSAVLYTVVAVVISAQPADTQLSLAWPLTVCVAWLWCNPAVQAGRKSGEARSVGGLVGAVSGDSCGKWASRDRIVRWDDDALSRNFRQTQCPWLGCTHGGQTGKKMTQTGWENIMVSTYKNKMFRDMDREVRDSPWTAGPPRPRCGGAGAGRWADPDMTPDPGPTSSPGTCGWYSEPHLEHTPCQKPHVLSISDQRHGDRVLDRTRAINPCFINPTPVLASGPTPTPSSEVPTDAAISVVD